MLATITGGTIAGYVTLGILLLACLAGIGYGVGIGVGHGDWGGTIICVVVSLVCAAVCVGLWWWGMAFTTSSDYHAWNVKTGKVDRVAKRLIATDDGMAERYVVTMDGTPYGVDDTRAALVKQGDRISLRCKKDYQWGTPRSAHGWACQWNGPVS